MPTASYKRAVSALLAVGMAVLTSTACGSLDLLEEPNAPAGPTRPAGETQVITVEVGPKDSQAGPSISTKRPGQEVELDDARPEVGRTPTPRTSETTGTIPSWQNWPTPVPVPTSAVAPGTASEPAADEPAPSGPAQRKQAAAVTPSRPVGAVRNPSAGQ